MKYWIRIRIDRWISIMIIWRARTGTRTWNLIRMHWWFITRRIWWSVRTMGGWTIIFWRAGCGIGTFNMSRTTRAIIRTIRIRWISWTAWIFCGRVDITSWNRGWLIATTIWRIVSSWRVVLWTLGWHVEWRIICIIVWRWFSAVVRWSLRVPSRVRCELISIWLPTWV